MFSALGSKRDRCPSPAPNKMKCLSKISEDNEEFSSRELTEMNWSSQDKKQSQRWDDEDPTVLSELSNTGICEMEAAYVSEMDADWQFSQELPDSEVSENTKKSHTSLLRTKPSATWSFLSTARATRHISPRNSRVSEFIDNLLVKRDRQDWFQLRSSPIVSFEFIRGNSTNLSICSLISQN